MTTDAWVVVVEHDTHNAPPELNLQPYTLFGPYWTEAAGIAALNSAQVDMLCEDKHEYVIEVSLWYVNEPQDSETTDCPACGTHLPQGHQTCLPCAEAPVRSHLSSVDG